MKIHRCENAGGDRDSPEPPGNGPRYARADTAGSRVALFASSLLRLVHRRQIETNGADLLGLSCVERVTCNKNQRGEPDPIEDRTYLAPNEGEYDTITSPRPKRFQYEYDMNTYE